MDLLAELRGLIAAASAEGRDLSAEEAQRADDLTTRIERAGLIPAAVLTRSQPGVERRMRTVLRAEVETAGNVLRGHAAVFNQVAEIFPGYEEDLADTAFDEVLKRTDLDTRALRDHVSSMLLGRTTSGTLRLGVDTIGLEFEVDLPNTTYANDLRELVARGDVTGASFGFIPGAEVLTRLEGGVDRVTHTSVADLLDVSPVTFPAYGGTDVALRAKNAGPAPDKSTTPVRLIRARARLLLTGVTK